MISLGLNVSTIGLGSISPASVSWGLVVVKVGAELAAFAPLAAAGGGTTGGGTACEAAFLTGVFFAGGSGKAEMHFEQVSVGELQQQQN